MKKILGFGILVFLILLIGNINIINAATDTNTVDDSFKINDIIDYKKPCFNNGTKQFSRIN